jgi:tryptophan synthase beta subunit
MHTRLNDMHILTVLQAKEGNQTLRDKVLEMTRDFVRNRESQGWTLCTVTATHGRLFGQ